MSKYTVNQLLVLLKEIRSRVCDLKRLRCQVAVKTTSFYGERETKEVEPQYDVKVLDKKITELENFLFTADAAIKQSNAVTTVDVEVDVQKLLEPLD